MPAIFPHSLENIVDPALEVFGDAKHDIAAWLQFAFFEPGHIRAAHPDPPSQVGLGNSSPLPPFRYVVRHHKGLRDEFCISFTYCKHRI
jgi:hypothetical protein